MKRRSMLRALPLLAVILFLVSQGCASDSSGDGDTGFVDPGLGDPGPAAAKDVAATSYNIAGQSCSSGGSTHCAAVIFDTEISHTTYSGFAARDLHQGGSDSFFLKVYWEGDIPASPFSGLPVTVKYRNGGTYCESGTATLAASVDATQADGSQRIYNITFTDTAPASCITSIPVTGGQIIGHRY